MRLVSASARGLADNKLGNSARSQMKILKKCYRNATERQQNCLTLACVYDILLPEAAYMRCLSLGARAPRPYNARRYRCKFRQLTGYIYLVKCSILRLSYVFAYGMYCK